MGIHLILSTTGGYVCQEAITECINEHILEEFLRRRGREVKKSMTIDMTFERREEIIRKQEREEGRQEGENLLANAIRRLKAGETEEALLQDNIGEETVKLALSLL